MKLLLIAPAEREMQGQKGKQIHNLGLAILAALATPFFSEIRIVEEHFEPIDVGESADLVGITMMTCHAPRAYALADAFRRRGIPTICGGSHATFMIDECLAHFDAVVAGEAEGVWPGLMADFLAGRLKKVYRGATPVDLKDLPMPRKDLFKAGGTLNAQVIQATRGCPLGCDYCTVTRVYGKQFRTRPVADVVEEIRRFPSRVFFFTDDNIFFSPAYAHELFEALVPLGIKWGSQASLDMACRDEHLLNLAARSGCLSLFVGIESIDQQTLNSVRKAFNRVDRYEQNLRRLRKAGITVVAAFMFGFDNDRLDMFDRVLDFATRNRLSTIVPGIVTPFPGTGLHERFEAENRILDRDWSHYTAETLVWRHPGMSADEMEKSYDALSRRFYTWRSIFTRAWANRAHPLYYFGMNIANRRRIYGTS